MAVSRDIFDLRTSGAYFPSLILILIRGQFSILNEPSYFGVSSFHILVFGSIIGAVSLHGLSRNVFGVGGPEENPLNKFHAIEGQYYAFVGEFPTAQQYESYFPIDLFKPSIVGWRVTMSVWIFSLAFLIWSASVFISLGYGVMNFDGLGTIPQLLFFAEIVWALQWIVWGRFSAYYLE